MRLLENYVFLRDLMQMYSHRNYMIETVLKGGGGHRK